MGYLNKSTITVDAVLTKKGRELLAKGRQGFRITQFAVSDDEVDYTLYDTAHPLGTAYYGSIIESMPLLEASTDETQALRFKLVTLPRGTKEVPIISLGASSYILTFGVSAAVTIVPSTSQGFNGPGFGYTAVLYDSTAAILSGTGLTTSPTTPVFIGEGVTNNATVVRGLQFTLAPRDVSAQTETQLTIIGNQTGASVTIPITIKPQPVATVG
jgi:hypothetical protein